MRQLPLYGWPDVVSVRFPTWRPSTHNTIPEAVERGGDVRPLAVVVAVRAEHHGTDPTRVRAEEQLAVVGH
jgi:hypothetical protein